MKKDYPRPQLKRETWQSLDGVWQFAFDDDNIGKKDKWFTRHDLPNATSIQVPFCVQSEQSGIQDTKDRPILWYYRSFQFDAQSQRVMLNFGAVDYKSEVYINGNHVHTNTGGNVPFSVEITDFIQSDKANHLHVRVTDDMHDIEIPRGKQYWKEEGESIFYTRTSGIWQTVWLERLPETHIKKLKIIPDILSNSVKIGYYITQHSTCEIETTITFKGETVSTSSKRVDEDYYEAVHYLGKLNDQGDNRFWSPEYPHLYDVSIRLKNGKTTDHVTSYFGMRKISIENGQVMLNNRPYMMRLVLDQGYYPKTLMTAPSDEALIQDIKLTKAMGFNGVRKHQKIEEERYLYYADHYGLLVWEEMPSVYKFSSKSMRNLIHEWSRVIERDYNHPSIVAWVPINESWGVPNLISSQREVHFLESMYHLTKAKDDTRLVVSNDGWEHGSTDLLTIHDYAADYDELKARYQSLDTTLSSMPGNRMLLNKGFAYQGAPILITEFGGISFQNGNQEGWGYSNATNGKDFEARLKAVFDALYESPIVQGVCYTQLTDIEQEINGLLTETREPKIPLETIKKIVENHT